MLTKSSITRGIPANFTLVRSEVLALALPDTYYSDTDNVEKVILHYRSKTGNQKKFVKFFTSVASPEALVNFSEKAFDKFEIIRISIHDFDGGTKNIYRSQLTVGQKTEFDISFISLDTSATKRYFRFVFDSSWSMDNNTPYNLLYLREVQMTWGGIQRSLAAYSPTVISGAITSSSGNGFERLYDNNITNGSMAAFTNLETVPASFSFDLGEPQAVTSVNICAGFMGGAVPKSWRVEGSNDGTAWSVIKSFENIRTDWPDEQYKNFSLLPEVYIRDFSNPNTLQASIESLNWADQLPSNNWTIANDALTIKSGANNAKYFFKLDQLGLTFVTGTTYKVKFYISDFVTGWAAGSLHFWLETFESATTPIDIDAGVSLGYFEKTFVAGPGHVNYGSLPVSTLRLEINTMNNGTTGVIKFDRIEVSEV